MYKNPHCAPALFLVAMLNASVLYPLVLCTPIVILALKQKKPAVPYPPGPKGYPILGNVLDLPTSVPIWESFTSLANTHCTLCHRCFLVSSELIS